MRQRDLLPGSGPRVDDEEMSARQNRCARRCTLANHEWTAGATQHDVQLAITQQIGAVAAQTTRRHALDQARLEPIATAEGEYDDESNRQPTHGFHQHRRNSAGGWRLTAGG